MPTKSHHEKLNSITLSNGQQPGASVIWLHGLGADGHDFANIVPQLNLPDQLAIRFIFPHAPIRPVAINNNFPMRAWYNIYSLENIEKVDEEGLEETRLSIEQLIEDELNLGIPSNKIILAGFSQGGAMALLAGLAYAKPLAGILALSTYLPLSKTALQNKISVNQHTPILMAHGQFDLVLPFKLGQLSYNHLRRMGCNVDWLEYPMGHEVCKKEIDDIAQWIRAKVPEPSNPL